VATGAAAALTALVAASPIAGTVMLMVRPPKAEAEAEAGFLLAALAAGRAAGGRASFVLEEGRAGFARCVLGRFPVVFGVVTVHIRSWVRDFAPQ